MSDTLLKVRVARKAVEALDIVSLELVATEGAGLPPFSAGSHVDLHLPNGISRQYSLCNDPTESHRYLLSILRDPASRGGSQAVHELVREGDELQISTPKNHFALVPEAEHSLLLAGGIGVTPILCMAERLAKTSASFEMHYCSRAPERTAFRARIGASPFADRVHFHFDSEGPQQRLALDVLLAQAAPGTHLYVCGPKGFMDAVLASARAKGWPEDRLHYEFFAGAAPVTDGQAFEVRLASSGRTVAVPAGQSVVAALAQAGVHIPVSCEQGVCGTCLTRVLDGQPDHQDMYLTPDEQERNDQFLPCCSRSKSALLVLDL
ncbi:PDR/VanB family oxidoreductase [Herbaspirillum autotrophicum]|uniref:PDR/VanB family oxidoreductase n=1 Tax=Herbaspirillum autotrophicum TaxID=180195 RepID=UPI00067B4BCB|nr:PDR/VanB family oxidoreductase [Herbaspirillum autotrophicum]